MAYFAEERKKFTVPASGCVEIRRDVVDDRSVFGYGIYLQCIPCGYELVENPERVLFECESCGYTVTGSELNSLASDYAEALAAVFVLRVEKEKKGIRWLLRTLFGSRKKQRALTS